MKAATSLKQLQRKLGHVFADAELLLLALTHRSFKGANNERLEFLGDAIVNFIIAEALFRQFPLEREGQLSRLRANLVNRDALAELATELGLGDYLRLGSGELKSGGFRRSSILEDAMEAIIGALYLDAGMDICRDCILVWYEQRLAAIDIKKTKKDPKSQLQELLQSRSKALPKYGLVKVEGEAHNQIFFVQCQIDGLKENPLGIAASRRKAEQQAAEKALELLKPAKKELT